MEKHASFDLLLHTRQELDALIPTGVRERVTLHEWPLSCVQRLVLADGTCQIYKAQSGPSVEPEFYARASSPLLLEARTLYRDEKYACMVFEDVETQPGTHLLSDLSFNIPQALEIGATLLNQLAEIGGSLPVWLDVSTWDRWQAVMDDMLQDLHGLVAGGVYRVTSLGDVRAIARAAVSPAVRAAYDGPVGLAHHDLGAENIFQMPGGYRVIDWQRPILGPTQTDLWQLLISLGVDPTLHMPPGILAAAYLLRIHWLSECSRIWFPPGTPDYDRWTAEFAAKLAA
jgi:hypothetical protein